MGTLRKITGVVAGTAAISALGLLGAPAASAASMPCSAKASACVDLSAKQAWLAEGGEVTYGPVPMASGKSGYRTPPGTFKVTYKDIDHWSKAFDGPMPYSVFFTNSGIAFHKGNIKQQSHGCIRLTHNAAVTFYNALQPGETVEVVR
ncbi:L,D-transpeptidase [Amycolatopsis magusensis]|uniref:Lipoprotein-anchoring transpeptidase ErfK/SrfK n=1 Tax=Amycolatopsis magusensis TaxID=882444 RepID=A0ABS4PKP9_9PSEU|nr:L,D-transpeptidase [Amycolatopsis magusensis]MBP2179999.1 lipoprotein-anchoring transpeptidase ErfK/SrfK [Amycolatopsis magusensis]